MTKMFMYSAAAAALIIAAPAAFAESPQPTREMAQTSTSDQQAMPGSKHEHRSASDEQGRAGAAAKSSEQSDATEGKSGTSAQSSESTQQKGTAAAGKTDESQGSSAASTESKPSENKSSAQKSQQDSEQSSQARGKGEAHGNAASADKTSGDKTSGSSAESGESGHASSAAKTSGTAAQAKTSGSEHQNAAMGVGEGHKIAPGKANRIRKAIRGEHVQKIAHADFSVKVGTVIPAHYHFYPLPEDIVSIVPEYRGYDYVVVSDEILIVEPQSHRIVYTLPENESASSEGHHSNCD
jgi:hypothetical protein